MRHLVTLCIGLAVALLPRPLEACHDGSPLILDLDGRGISTTNALFEPVDFDIDADGDAEPVGWTNPDTEEGFLWLDLNRNRLVDDGGELFGDATRLPTGEEAENGFQALAVYDRIDLGGDEDGLITRGDLIWEHLRVWVDANHDGISQPQEVRSLNALQIEAIELEFQELGRLDGALNRHELAGRYWRGVPVPGAGLVLQEFLIEDVFLKIRH